MIRTQLFLDEAMHARLRSLARAQGRTVSDLVREAIQRSFLAPEQDEWERTLRGICGLWRDRDEIGDGSAYVRSLRKDTRRLRSRRG
ncbi:MAG: ribbon-helix-helix protein, CopG family [Candidatus Eisenbacteria bacterium]|uniref:Ribbon-helix-helix protein, CopG family n=1 Tax=Eiseniibacteriota bacterium TaxID=2212470 RepID=A0A933SGR3_UNCEI|nr:ribbon-helix-helix protein, CopG family [Candidatus Eisenbacteria bacterium]